MLACVKVSTSPTTRSLGSRASLTCTLRRCLAVSREGREGGK